MYTLKLEGIRATRATPGPILPLLARFVSGFCVARLGLPSLVASVLLGLACRVSLSSFRPKKASLFSFFLSGRQNHAACSMSVSLFLAPVALLDSCGHSLLQS